MRKITAVTALALGLTLAGCAKDEADDAVDDTAPAAAPAPAPAPAPDTSLISDTSAVHDTTTTTHN